jgi:uroporphyrinogen-III synthase
MLTEALAGQRILVTRPEAQADGLAERIRQNGGEAILFPVIRIENSVNHSNWQALDLNRYNWLIFVSRNAVEGFQAAGHATLPEGLRLAAVGDGTASAMRAAGLAVDCQPDISNGSEGLLQMPAMQNLSGQQVLIVRGDGGRELLADTLSARGATINYIEVYRRALASHDRSACMRAMHADKLVCTSVAGVDNLCRILTEFKADLFCKPLVVISERIKQHARTLGFRWVEVSHSASDDAVLQTLIDMDKQHGE